MSEYRLMRVTVRTMPYYPCKTAGSHWSDRACQPAARCRPFSAVKKTDAGCIAWSAPRVLKGQACLAPKQDRLLVGLRLERNPGLALLD